MMSPKMERFRTDRRGISAITFGLAAVPLAVLVALGIDFAGVTAAKIKLESAADAGLLAAITTAASSAIANPDTYLTIGETAGKQRFKAQAGQVISASTPVPTLSLTRSGANVVGTINWSASYNTFLGSIVNVTNWPISGLARASMPVSTPYLNVEILLDNSGSMEIGATPSDIATMEELTACAVSNAYYCNGTKSSKHGSSYCDSWVQSNGLPTASPYYTAASSGQSYNAYACSSGSYTYNGSPACPLQGETLGNISYPNFPASGAQPSAINCPSLLPLPTPTTPAYSYKGYAPVAGPPCAFACHFDTSSSPGTGTDFYALARSTIGTSYQVTLRFDQVKSAVKQVISAMQTDNMAINNLNVGIFWFADVLSQVYPSSGEAGNDWATATNDVGGPASVANGADTGIPPYVGANGGNTDFTGVMSSLASTLTASGDGSSATSPQKVLFIVTDGLNDPASRDIAAFDPSACTQFKNMGYTIYVLYTPYYDLMNGYYLNGTTPSAASIVQASASATNSIPYNLQQCASSASTYLEASDTAGIASALQTFLKLALTSPAKFTQ
jgi:Flp pilus assembly protein TadG